MNYYQHHIGDFIRDTARLTDSQCMAYLRMIWAYYETEAPLADDVDAIAFRIGANASDVQQILRHFFFLHEGMWHHSRCDKEVLAFREKSDKAKKSADARWKNANAMRTHTDRNANEPVFDANQEPITNNQEKEVNPTSLRDGPLSREKKKSKAVPLTEWLVGVKERGEKILSGYEPLWKFCATAGIPADWIEIAWIQFRDRYTTDEKAKRKRYSDWRRVFKRAVEENWLRLWFYSDRDQAFRLSTVGVAADLATREVA